MLTIAEKSVDLLGTCLASSLFISQPASVSNLNSKPFCSCHSPYISMFIKHFNRLMWFKLFRDIIHISFLFIHTFSDLCTTLNPFSFICCLNLRVIDLFCESKHIKLFNSIKHVRVISINEN